MSECIAGTWKAIGLEIYEVDDLGNPGNFLAMARDQRVAARMADTHNSMLAALKNVRSQLEQYERDATGESYNSPMLNAAIAKAEGTKP